MSVINTFLDYVPAVRVRTRLEVPCKALLQFQLRQTVHRIKHTYTVVNKHVLPARESV